MNLIITGGAKGAIAGDTVTLTSSLNLAKRLYKMTDYFSITLHGKAKALNVIKTLKSMRNKVTFSNLWEAITKLARGIPVLPRRKNCDY